MNIHPDFKEGDNVIDRHNAQGIMKIVSIVGDPLRDLGSPKNSLTRIYICEIETGTETTFKIYSGEQLEKFINS